MSNFCKGRWCLFALLATLAVGCDFPGRPNPADRPVPADQVMEFGILYRQNCAGCHGSDGKLGPAPPLNDPLFRAIVPEQELESILTLGRKNTLMPAFAKENGGTLTAAQIQVLVKEIKGISYKVIEKKDAGLAKVEVVTDAAGIAPRWGSLQSCQKVCRPTASIRQAPSLPLSPRGQGEGSRGLCPCLCGMSW